MNNPSAVSLWGYQEHQQTLDELKDKLRATIWELEDVKNIAREEIKKKDDYINQLIQLVKAADQERDEAKDQLQMLLNKLTMPNSIELCTAAPFLQAGSPQLRQALGSSSITESENNQSHVSSPSVVDSFIDASISLSPQLSNVNIADSCNVLVSQQQMGYVCAPPVSAQDDLMEALFDGYAKKPLPVKGRLLEAVMDAGPILDTLLVAGSLPQWRNPPPLKHLMVPPMSIRRSDAYIPTQNAALNPSSLIQNCNAVSPMDSYGFGAVCKAKTPLMANCEGSLQCLTSKRQRSK